MTKPGDEDTNDAAGPSPSRGIWIVLATLVPTLLAIVFGIPHLAGLPTASRSPVNLQGDLPPAVPSLALGRAIVGAQPVDPAPLLPTERLTMRSVGQANEPARVPSTPTREFRGNAAVPAVDAWVRGPAFPHRDAAEHFAARMERVGFPATVRREDTRGAHWVVWFAKDHEE